MIRPEVLDDYMAPDMRRVIERDYYKRINTQCSLAEALKDPLFRRNPTNHVALFSDHGVVHVRDVARQVLQVLQAVHGVLIPARDARPSSEETSMTSSSGSGRTIAAGWRPSCSPSVNAAR